MSERSEVPYTHLGGEALGLGVECDIRSLDELENRQPSPWTITLADDYEKAGSPVATAEDARAVNPLSEEEVKALQYQLQEVLGHPDETRLKVIIKNMFIKGLAAQRRAQAAENGN